MHYPEDKRPQSITAPLSYFATWGRCDLLCLCQPPSEMHRQMITALATEHACVRKSRVYYFNCAYGEGIWRGIGSIHQNAGLEKVIDQEALRLQLMR